MTCAVDVLVDRTDDVNTTQAIHALARSKPNVLAISIAPDARLARGVIWAVLRALGKRSECLTGPPGWHHAQIWLAAHQVTEVVVLRAHHLRDDVCSALRGCLQAAGVRRATLVYSGEINDAPAPTTTLTQLLKRPRHPPAVEHVARRWPIVPRAHPLRLRYECATVLADDQFRQVEQLFAAAYRTLSAWLSINRRPTPDDLALALAVVTAARDPEQAFVRRCGAELALMLQQLPAPQVSFALLDPSRHDRTPDLARPRAYTEPAHAGYELVGAVTGLPTDLIELIGGDQLDSSTILSVPAPPGAQPVLRAVGRGFDPVLGKPRRSSLASGPKPHVRRLTMPIEKPMSTSLLNVLNRLLNGRYNAIRPDQIDAKTRDELDQLRTQGIVDFYDDAFRSSPIALYGSLAGPLPPLRSTDINAGRSTDTRWESH